MLVPAGSPVDIGQGRGSVTLTVEWEQYPGGPDDDVSGLTITIKAVDGTVVLGPTVAGIAHTATGMYSYTWTIPLGTPNGSYVVVWDATNSDNEAVQATEQISVGPILGPLATAQDVSDQLGRDLTTAELARVPGLLAAASARIRRYTGQDFTYVENDPWVTRADGDQVRLPQRPVVAVTSVVAVGTNGLPDVPLVGWWWDGLGIIYLRGLGIMINLPEWWLEGCVDYTYRIVYSHGYVNVPGDVIDVAVGMVLRTLTAPTQAGGVSSETIGSYSYRLENAGVGLSVTLSKDDKDALADYRVNKSQGTVRMQVR